jgi:hypothetical protein
MNLSSIVSSCALSLVFVTACGDDGGDSADEDTPEQLDASFRGGYLASDECRVHADDASCGENAGCEWYRLPAGFLRDDGHLPRSCGASRVPGRRRQ